MYVALQQTKPYSTSWTSSQVLEALPNGPPCCSIANVDKSGMASGGGAKKFWQTKQLVVSKKASIFSETVAIPDWTSNIANSVSIVYFMCTGA